LIKIRLKGLKPTLAHRPIRLHSLVKICLLSRLRPENAAMRVELFHDDNAVFFDLTGLRRRAAETVCGLSLIRQAEEGDRAAAVALKVGFWPFVREFEFAIDRQSLPRQALVDRFGERRVRQVFAGIAGAVRDMKQEEGSHAAHWMRDAQCLSVNDFGGPCTAGIQALIDRAYTRHLPGFFAMLAGTEFMAEELARLLVASTSFTRLFSRERWVWGEVHLMGDEDSPSHLDIDLDLARAYQTATGPTDIEDMVCDTFVLFARAADDVAEALLPQLAA
jgi:hypothetical protein